MKNSNWGSMYRQIGVEPVINAIGNVSVLGGSIASPQVRAAMEAASDAFAPMLETAEAAGAAVAEMLGVDAAWITSGAGSAIALSTAACMAGDDPERIAQLPDTKGLRNEFIIQARQRYTYDRCLEVSGGRIIEAGTQTPVSDGVNRTTGAEHHAKGKEAPGTSEDDLVDTIGNRTAAIHYVADTRVHDPNLLSFEQVLQVAKNHNVPIIVDAAGQVYPTENLRSYAAAGASLVCYGAKYIQAPHSTGFVAGEKDLVHAVSRQSFAAFETLGLRAIGRPHKVDRQEMIGVVAAVREWLTMNHEDRFATYDARIKTITEHIGTHQGLSVTAQRETVGGSSYGVLLEIDPEQSPISLQQLVDALKAGSPPVWTRVVGGRMLIAVNCLSDGEDEMVGTRIAQVLNT